MDWRKSSFSNANGGACVETANGAGVILVRDTTDREGFTLSVPADAWSRFTTCPFTVVSRTRRRS
jgi:uncharacterized protein DUF397